MMTLSWARSLSCVLAKRVILTRVYMVPSSRGKRWTIPDHVEDAAAGDGPMLS